MDKRAESDPSGGGSLAPTMLGLGWALAPISTIIVLVRAYVRCLLVRTGLKPDDWVMFLSLVTMLVCTVFDTISISYGLGTHIDQVQPKTNIVQAIKWDYWAQPLSIMAPAFGRVSFALTLRGVAGNFKSRHWILYFIIFEQLVSNIICFILILVQCQPVERLWDRSIPGQCWPLTVQEYVGYFQGALNTVTDLCLAVFPAIIVWSLNMRTSLKISLIVILGLGLFAMVASIVKTVMIHTLGSSTDYTYTTSNLVIWYTIENYLVIIAASIPTLKPLITTYRKHTTGGSDSKLYPSRTHRLNTWRERSGYHPTGSLPEVNEQLSNQPSDGGDQSSQRHFLPHEDANFHENSIRRTIKVSVDVENEDKNPWPRSNHL